jgi:hypothetical protein
VNPPIEILEILTQLNVSCSPAQKYGDIGETGGLWGNNNGIIRSFTYFETSRKQTESAPPFILNIED